MEKIRRSLVCLCAGQFTTGTATQTENTIIVCWHEESQTADNGANIAGIYTMIVTAGFLVAGIGLGLIFRELRKAPEGYEDENGFHVIRKTATGSKATRLRPMRADHHPRTRPAIAL